MRWRDFKPWEKVAIVVLGLWFTVGWFVAAQSPNPALFMAIPMIAIVGAMALLWVLSTVTAWLLRVLGR